MEQTAKEEEGDESSVEDHWYLVDAHGQKFRLPKTMLFLGREECDVVVASQSVDKRHAVLTFDIYLNRFKVKDLSTTHGTYVNNQPIQEQEYVTLNHMDSVRLGNDTMMYHIEQGSQITSQGGHLPDHRVIPSWASRRASQDTPAIHVHTHTMAECQGCIAEQSIEHSCGLHTEKTSTDGVVVNDPNHCMYPGTQQANQNCQCMQQQQQSMPPQCHHHPHQHPHHPHAFHQIQQQRLQGSSPDPQSLNHPLPEDYPYPYDLHHHQHHHHHHQQQQQHHQQIEHRDQQHQHLNDNLDNSHNLCTKGDNPDFMEDECDDGDDVMFNDGQDDQFVKGRNTWPRKRPRQVPHANTLFGTNEMSEDPSNVTSSNGSESRPAGPVSAMYFVSFDDSVCNGSTKDLTINGSTKDLTTNGDTNNRISRSYSRPGKDTVSTAKKGTPLYGQPDWWGESDDTDGHSGQPTSSGKHDNGTTPKHNVDKQDSVGSEDVPTTPIPEVHRPVVASRGSTYMEIPVHDDVDVTSDGKEATDRRGLPTSISKDSLYSPKTEEASQNIKDLSPSGEKNPAMSFTIELDDHPPRKINIGTSLSQFVPTKIRKKTLERKDKSTAVNRTSSAESTPSKNSEERELSPNNQRKIEEIWSSLESKGKPSQLSSVQATAGSSLRSPNLEDIEKLSELSAEDRRSTERDGEKKGRKPVTSKTSPKVPRAKVGSVKPVNTVSLSQYTDATTYLIDKMFEGEAGGDGSPKEMSPEQKMYKEAASHDKPKNTWSRLDKRTSGANRKVSSSSGKSETKPTATANATVKSKVSATKTTVKKDNSCDKNEDEDLKIVEKVVCDDKEDKASEAGTYTIEADEKEAEEEEQARLRIDEVFGVEGDLLTCSFGRPIIQPLRSLASPGGYDNVRDDDGDDDDDGDKTPLDENGTSLVDSLMIDEDYDNLDKEDEEQEEEDSDAMGTEGVQTWVSQLTALTSHKAAVNNQSLSESTKQAWDEANDPSLSKKPPHGLNRKRPGTGRKLPSIPTDRSPVSSEHSSHVGEQDVSGLEDSMSLQTSDILANGKTTTNGRLSPSTKLSSRVSSQLSNSSPSKPAATSATNGHGLESPSDRRQHSSTSSPAVSSRSRGSVDTQLLLQDTETVMAAMEARMAHKNSTNHRVDNSHNQDDSDTDASSTVALVNGDEAYKPTMYRSPREALSKSKRHHTSDSSKPSANNTSPSSVASAKKSLGGIKPSSSQTGIPSKSRLVASPRNTSTASLTTKKSVVSDILSRTDSFDNDSIVSDVGSDAGDSVTSRSSSKTKGAMSMTKPNRAFQLRRARADSTDEPPTPRSAKSSGRTTGGASVRSTSLHSTSRMKTAMDSGRSEASLGGQIVRKSRNNDRTDKSRTNSTTALDRSDGGRHSLRLQRASSLTIAPQSSLTFPGKRENTPKSHLKSTYSSSSKGNLSITGVSSGSRPQSQPGSRSNSPKAAERMAWKRRKEYDPRRAVAEAKAKSKDPGTVSSASSVSSVSMRSKPSTRDNSKRRMIRSASFGNAVNMTAHDSLSNSHGLSMPERKEHQNDEGFRRAFMPVRGSSSLQSDRSAHSADEDDTLSSFTSTQANTKGSRDKHVLKSAFTPPLVKTTCFVTSGSPTPLFSLRRRNSYHDASDTLSLSVAPGMSNMDLDELSPPNSALTTPQTSYDSLIVSSIYQLSLKLSTTTDKSLHRLREENRVSFTPSPIDDYLSDVGKSDMPAWKSANQELAGVLRNLRKLERHVTMMNRVLFPDEEMDSDMITGREKQKYFQEIERIRSELAGFHPIDNPRRDEYEATSPEMEEFSETF